MMVVRLNPAARSAESGDLSDLRSKVPNISRELLSELRDGRAGGSGSRGEVRQRLPRPMKRYREGGLCRFSGHSPQPGMTWLHWSASSIGPKGLPSAALSTHIGLMVD